ncbi:phosphoenolpyruvate--protein phosphotransferase [bacterium]|nr:phosphoenolpyruvate--protein phosphotransferase [bacterium]
MGKKLTKKNLVLDGVAVSPGIAIGLAFLLHHDELQVEEEEILPDQVASEVEKFKRAIQQTKEELRSIRRRVSRDMGEEQARIFDVQLLMLDDVMAFDETISAIQDRKRNAEFLFWENLNTAIEAIEASDHAFFRERAADIKDLGRRVLHNLLGIKHLTISGIRSEVVVVSPDLSPTDTIMMHRKNILGFATDMGGRTSHAAIMARSLEIPSVVGLRDATSRVEHGETIILDGNKGTLVIAPDEKLLEHYRAEQRKYLQWSSDLAALRDLPAHTLDHQAIQLHANIEFPDETDSALSHGATGIGLYRTEFLYLSRTDLPGEEEQFKAYKSVAEKMIPNPVTIRTFDLGGDKFSMYLKGYTEANPFLGQRAIRLCLQHPDIFKVQLAAILRASAAGNMKIIFPMISGIEQLRQAKEILGSVQEDLRARGVPIDPDIPVGVMIEIPSAVLVADSLAREVDFFSIGTNDLIQYTLAVDRGNEQVAELFDAFHPAVLKLIKQVVEAGQRAQIPVAICGEMCAEPMATVLLLGLGFDEFSMSSVSIPQIKKIIRSVNMEEARAVALHAIELETGRQIKAYLKEQIGNLHPDFLTADMT